MNKEHAIKLLEEYKGYSETLDSRLPIYYALDMAIQALQAEPYKEMTNGEVIKTIFPNTQIKDINSLSFISFTLDGIVGTTVEKEWWNSPYTGE